ncbi:unnamed protein product, partial [Ceratitis capitata]
MSECKPKMEMPNISWSLHLNDPNMRQCVEGRQRQILSHIWVVYTDGKASNVC